MKATRLLLTAVILTVVSACTAGNITGPSATDLQPTQADRGTIGSGLVTNMSESTEASRGTIGSGLVK